MSYEKLDTPQILQYIYYPRRDHTHPPAGCETFNIVVDQDNQVSIGCRFYFHNQDWPLLVYFHGNGEVAADYDDIASFYLARGINLFVADFRGYGSSSGQPTIASQLSDAPRVFKRAVELMKERGYAGRAYVMGRSMGSLSALEIVTQNPHGPAGLIIESGFCCISRLIKLFGLPADAGALEQVESRALENIGQIKLPALVIHGDRDTLVPLEEGQLIYDHLASADKQLMIIPRATHNDIMFMDIRRYFGAIDDFIGGGQPDPRGQQAQG